jgi:hypothetical protein
MNPRFLWISDRLRRPEACASLALLTTAELRLAVRLWSKRGDKRKEHALRLICDLVHFVVFLLCSSITKLVR